MGSIAVRWWWLFMALAVGAGVVRSEDAMAPRPQTLAIGRVAKPPVLDGKLDEWGRASFLLGEARQTLRRAGRWAGALDASAAVWLGWDEQYLYVAADVIDDKLMQAHGGAEPWQGDTLELFFNVHPGQQRVDGFWQIALIPPLESGQKLRVTGPQKEFEGVEGTAAVHKGGYTLECRIPWKNLTGFVPGPGAQVGLQVMLDDRDDAGLKSRLTWYPSAITFNHRLQMNTLVLKEQGETSGPPMVAGPTTEVVTNPNTMTVSVLTELPGAEKAVVKVVRGNATALVEREEGVLPTGELKLVKLGDRVAVGEGPVDIAGYEGEAEFEVEVQTGGGEVLMRSRFVTELGGRKYEAMKAMLAECQKAVKALPASVDEVERGGLGLWVQRIADLVPNEARPETVSATLLAQ
ncbi:MAG: sugar-binding protein, partial [Phycisphaerae bacterium]